MTFSRSISRPRQRPCPTAKCTTANPPWTVAGAALWRDSRGLMPATPPARRASTPSSPAATAGGRMGDEIRRGAAASSCNRSGDPAARRGHRGRRALGPAQPAAQAHGAGGVRGARDTPPGPTAPSTPPRRPPRGSQPREGGWRFGSMRAVRHPTARRPSPRPPACGWPARSATGAMAFIRGESARRSPR